MAKRIKHPELLDAVEEQKIEDPAKTTAASNLEFTKVKQEKIENYDKLVEENSKLMNEKADLIDSTASYLEEIDKLKDVISKFDSEKKKFEKEVNKLKNDITQLQDACDDYLMKISDLNFENAKLAAQLQEVRNNHVDTSGTEIRQSEKFHVKNDPYNPYKQNGYDSWN